MTLDIYRLARSYGCPHDTALRVEGLIEASRAPSDLPINDPPILDAYELARSLGCTEAVSATLRDQIENDQSGGWFRTLWTVRLNDPSWRMSVPREVTKYLNPPTVDCIIEGCKRSLDPLDPDTIRVKAWIAAAGAGGTFVAENIETGEIEGKFELPGSKMGSAPLN